MSLHDVSLIKEQYKDGTNLDARVALHLRFSVATRDFQDWVFDHIDVPANACVLEIGCGTGALWEKVRSRVPPAWQVTLTDFSFGMVTGTRRDLSGFENPTGLIQFAQADAQAIPFPDETFDAVIANHMLYHVPDLPRALAEIRRVLKDGGKLYAATNGQAHMWELRELALTLGIEAASWFESSFALENGMELLTPYFASVEREDFPDALHITEVEPLVAYLASMRAAKGWLTDERRQQFRSLAAERIARDGAIRIRKETGLFVARK